MDIGSISAASGAGAQLQASVKVATNQQDQQEAVVGKILEGIEETPAPRGDGAGQLLNVVA